MDQLTILLLDHPHSRSTMHAPLNVSDRQLREPKDNSIRSKANRSVCREYIEALEACHARGFYKLVGGCNQVKKDLSMCLRQEVSLSLLSPFLDPCLDYWFQTKSGLSLLLAGR